ncbi:hypothetical protein [Paraburkholderia aspalathi]|uniref:hypothetical protein n=1 Tax=Paraburkholderia aspalathi TaxID=1324617 RepID=UPI001B0CF611|nr:hypothetical protein [Paraburkholderia aspalathi]CAE6768422.1 hypothetical protein R20943_03753 [Paraburkholderia aspalathi]
MKRIGLAILMATLTPAVYAAGYTEVWNPPEARATAPHRAGAARKLAVHRPVVAHPVNMHARRTPTSAPRLLAKQSHVQKTAPTDEPDMSAIPRQFTPEGNVLRVDSRGMSAEVTR